MTAIVVVYDRDEEESGYRLFETLEQAIAYAEEQVRNERYDEVFVATITHQREVTMTPVQEPNSYQCQCAICRDLRAK